MTIVQVVGIYQHKFAFRQAREAARNGSAPEQDTPEPTDEEVLNDWMISLIKTMRADMDNDKLYPPGMVYILVSPQTAFRSLLRSKRAGVLRCVCDC